MIFKFDVSYVLVCAAHLMTSQPNSHFRIVSGAGQEGVMETLASHVI